MSSIKIYNQNSDEALHQLLNAKKISESKCHDVCIHELTMSPASLISR